MIDYLFWDTVRDQFLSIGATWATTASALHGLENVSDRVHFVVRLDVKQLSAAILAAAFFMAN